jgi:hypothetical protein
LLKEYLVEKKVKQWNAGLTTKEVKGLELQGSKCLESRMILEKILSSI